MAEITMTNLDVAEEIIKKTTEAQLKAIRKGVKVNKQAFILYSLPGVGKSQMLRSLAKDENHVQIIDINAEFGGSLAMPIQSITNYEEDGRVYQKAQVLHALHEQIMKLNELAKENPEEPYYLVLDEINRGDDFMHQTLMQLVLNLRLPGHVLEDNIFIVGAGNTSENIFTDDEVSNDVNAFDSASRDRIAPLFITLDEERWLEWAYLNQINTNVIRFIEQNKNMLYNPSKMEDHTGATPRSYQKLSDLLDVFDPATTRKDILRPLLVSQLGEEAGRSFNTFLSQAPPFDIKHILSDPAQVEDRVKDLSRIDLRQVVSMAPAHIESALKIGNDKPFLSLERILETTNDQQALQRFINIFIAKDGIRKNYPELHKRRKKSEIFDRMITQYAVNA